MTSLWWARLTTTHFNFDAFGATKTDAEAVLVRLTKRHCKNADVPWNAFFRDYWDDIAISEVRPGYGFRDYDKVYESH